MRPMSDDTTPLKWNAGKRPFPQTGSLMPLNEVCATWTPRLLSVMRAMSALLLMQHGTAKFLGIPQMEAFAKLQPYSLSWFAGLFELFGGALLLIGLFTRPVAFVLSGVM